MSDRPSPTSPVTMAESTACMACGTRPAPHRVTMPRRPHMVWWYCDACAVNLQALRKRPTAQLDIFQIPPPLGRYIPLACRLGWHMWWHMVDTRVYRYQQCVRCDGRRAVKYIGGYQPLNYDWLAGRIADFYQPPPRLTWGRETPQATDSTESP
jgi:hypothetical protein